MPRHKHPTKTVTLQFDNNRLARDLFGPEDVNLRTLEKKLGCDIAARGAELKISGPESGVAICEEILMRLFNLLKKGYPIIGSDFVQAINLLSRDKNSDIESLFKDSIFLPSKQKVIMPRSPAQRQYIEAIRANDIVFSVGPAGTGKSYLAVAMGVEAISKKEFSRIVLARPAVEAGEKLGFLPGSMQEKVNPYIRPLYDALYDMITPERVEEMIEDDIIEIAPLAFMRGRTLHRSFIILDEAQNASYHQMKMCLTRMGLDSKMVVNGDVTQIDLPSGEKSGLLEAWRILEGCPGIAFHRFTEVDVVRHPLVCEIVKAYQLDEDNHGS